MHTYQRSFDFYYQGKVYTLPYLLPSELRVLRHVAENPLESRADNAIALGIAPKTLQYYMSAIFRQWAHELQPMDNMYFNRFTRLKLCLEILEVFQDIEELQQSA